MVLNKSNFAKGYILLYMYILHIFMTNSPMIDAIVSGYMIFLKINKSRTLVGTLAIYRPTRLRNIVVQ